MGVQLPRSPVRLSLFRCPALFVPLFGSLAPPCTASLFRCPALLLPSVRLLCFVVRLSRCSVRLPRLIRLVLFLSRVPYIYCLFFYMGDKSGRVASLISWRKPFPHPTPFFGFNTSCFWRRKVLYLYRDMGGAAAPPFFCHFPFKNGDFRSASGKNLPSSNFDLPSSNFSFPSSK